MNQQVAIAHNVALGGGAPLCLIAGPCVIESAAHAKFMAKEISQIAAARQMPYVFKASYDKANRSHVGNFRGPGLRAGLDILAEIKAAYQLPLLTDIHAVAEVAPAAAVVDVLQIPAFLCRQTDILLAAGEAPAAVNIKKGQFMSPAEMQNALGKVCRRGDKRVTLTERGSSFGYNNLVVDMRGLPQLRAYAPVVFDATHSAQLPGGQGTASGGDRQLAAVLARAAVAAGVDGIFLEVHDQPAKAKCDGPNMIALADLPALLETLQKLHQVVGAAAAKG